MSFILEDLTLQTSPNPRSQVSRVAKLPFPSSKSLLFLSILSTALRLSYPLRLLTLVSVLWKLDGLLSVPHVLYFVEGFSLLSVRSLSLSYFPFMWISYNILPVVSRSLFCHSVTHLLSKGRLEKEDIFVFV